jgi:hypothetical protein
VFDHLNDDGQYRDNDNEQGDEFEIAFDDGDVSQRIAEHGNTDHPEQTAAKAEREKSTIILKTAVDQLG